MNSPKFNLKLFGEFTIKIDDEPISKPTAKLSKIWEAFIILAMTKDNPIENEVLMNNLWRGDMSTNPQNALKNVIYCLRRDICDKNCINTSIVDYTNGKYLINKNFDIKIDADELEEIYNRMQDDSLTDDELIEGYRSIVTIYSTGFCLKQSIYPYAKQWIDYYRTLYINACSKLCDILYNNLQFLEIIELCNHVTSIEPFNQEIYLHSFKAHKKLKQYNTIIQNYHQLNNFLLVEQGTESIDEIKEIYDFACVNINPLEQDIVLIRAELRANIVNSANTKKAYFCSYEVFKHMCDIKIRDASRHHKDIALILMSVTDFKDALPEDETLDLAMDDIRHIIASSLRKGDVFAKYNKSQFVILMATDSVPRLHKTITTRINSNFSSCIHSQNMKLNSLVLTV